MRQLVAAGWVLLTEGLDAEQLDQLEDELYAPPAGSREAQRERAALVKSLKGG